MKACVVIPARYKSSRFPGKPLAKILGREMIIWVAELSSKAVGKSNVFIATEMGISILETSFNSKNYENNIGVSPNPFIVGEDSEIIFSNIPSDAVVKLISLNGSILKTFNMKDFNRNVKWNGKSDNGRKIPSGVYLLSSYNKNLGSKTTKLAIINK